MTDELRSGQSAAVQPSRVQIPELGSQRSSLGPEPGDVRPDGLYEPL